MHTDPVSPRRRRYRRRLAAAAIASIALHLLLARGLAVTNFGRDGARPAAAAPQPKAKPRSDFTIRVARNRAARLAHERPLATAAARPAADRAIASRRAAGVTAERRSDEPADRAPSRAPDAPSTRPRDVALASSAAPSRAAATPAVPATTQAETAPAAPAAADTDRSPATVARPRDASDAVASRWLPREAALLERLAAPAVARPAVPRDATAAAPAAAAPLRRTVTGAAAAATVPATIDAVAPPRTAGAGPVAVAPADRNAALRPAPRAASVPRDTMPPGDRLAPLPSNAPAAVTDLAGFGPRRDTTGGASAGTAGPGSQLEPGGSRSPGRAAVGVDVAAADTAAAIRVDAPAGGTAADAAAPAAPGPRAVGRATGGSAEPQRLAATVARRGSDAAVDDADDDAELSTPAITFGTAVGKPRRDDDRPAAALARPPERVAAVALPAETRVRDVAEAFARRGRDARADRRTDPRVRRADEIVDRGLGFLARSQQADGRWSLGRFAGGRATDAPELASDTAATGLALLAFLGAGHDHFDGPHRDTVRRGLEFLLSVQKPGGDLYLPADDLSNSCAWLYSHGIASIALCEAVGMTGDPLLKPAAARACGFIAASRHPERGGWRYQPGTDADLSVSGWMLVALRSGALAGIETDARALAGVRTLLDAAATADPARYAYNPLKPDQRASELSSLCMTAVGALMRLHTGAKPDDPRVAAAARVLAARRPTYDARGRDCYLWYYASQVLVHTGGADWDAWYAALVTTLATAQETVGTKAGSWDPLGPRPDRWGRWGGRIYVTTLHLLALEVPDRRLPTYTARD